jgi:hypothetical protein
MLQVVSEGLLWICDREVVHFDGFHDFLMARRAKYFSRDTFRLYNNQNRNLFCTRDNKSESFLPLTNMNAISKIPFIILFAAVFMVTPSSAQFSPENTSPIVKPAQVKRYLYVAVPGIRNYLEYGGHGILVYDLSDNYRLVKRIDTGGLKADGTPSNVKGVAVSLATNSIYITTLEALQRIDLSTEKIVWEKKYEGGCDRLSISPDGKVIYLPTLEKEHWNVVDAETGDVIKQIFTNSGAHNTLYGGDGVNVFLAGLHTNTLGISDARTHAMIRQVGPFCSTYQAVYD